MPHATAVDTGGRPSRVRRRMTSRPRSERQATPPSERPPTFSGFVVRLLVYLFLASLLFSLGGLHERMGPIQEGMAWMVGAGGNLLGADATVDGTIIKSPHA